MSDQLERDVEAALARLATQAVPDTERPPAPPWQERRRSVDARRFGRATPWLIAAVLLVIAGLGIGAGVSFDASAPDRGPVGTAPPSPTGTVTAPDGTLGTPVSTPTATSTPSFDRSSNGAEPDDGVLQVGAGIGRYGPVLVGMTADETWAALGVSPGNPVSGGLGPSCASAVPMPGTGDPGRPPEAILDGATGKVIAFFTRSDTVDAFGNGEGTTLAQLRVSYPGGQLNFGQAGWTFTVLGPDDTGLGFRLSSDAVQDQQPADSDTVSYLLPGVADYARGYELCVG